MAIGSWEVALQKEEVIQKRAENRFRAVINKANENRQQNESIKCRIDLQSPTKSEPSKADRALLTKLGKQQAGDQESAQDKKEVDASPSKLHQRLVPTRVPKQNGMAENDQQDGHSAEAIQLHVSGPGNRFRILHTERFRDPFVAFFSNGLRPPAREVDAAVHALPLRALSRIRELPEATDYDQRQ